MRRIKGLKKLAAAAILAGTAVSVPAVGFMPSAVIAAETDSLLLNVKQSEGGTASSSASGSINYGEVVSLSAVADDGYRFAFWKLRSNGDHEIISGKETDAEINVRVDNSDSGLFTAEPVFVKNGMYVVKELDKVSFAMAGDKIDISSYFTSHHYEDEVGVYFGHSYAEAYRLSDRIDVSDECIDGESGILTVPDYDIELGGVALLGSYTKQPEDAPAEKVLDEEFIDGIFSIENATDGIAWLPESAASGDEIDIGTMDDEDAGSYSYKIERVSDGADMTGMLMIAGADNRFVMPAYDIRITANVIESAEASGAEAYSEEARGGTGEIKENILAEYFPAEEAENTAQPAVESSEGEASEAEASLENKEISVKEEPVVQEIHKEELPKEDDSLTSENQETEKTGLGSATQASDSTKLAVRVQSNAGSAATATRVNSPAAVRAEGANSTSSNSVSAPATGDYSAVAAFTCVSIAAGAGIAAAAIMLKRKNAN